MDARTIEAAADALWSLWQADERAPELREDLRPVDLDDGWAIQRALDSRIGPRVGWKIASTSQRSQDRLGLSEPLMGPLYEVTLVPDESVLGSTYLEIIEAEFAVTMQEGPDPAHAPFSRQAIEGCIATINLGMEVPDSRLTKFPHMAAPEMMADFMLTRYYAVGPTLSMAPSDLRDAEIVMRRNGHQEAKGRGSDVLGDPCNALLWLANALAEKGVRFEEGDLVTTGACAVVDGVKPGDTVSATLDTGAEMSLSIAPLRASSAAGG